jgi:hypothetical protein
VLISRSMSVLPPEQRRPSTATALVRGSPGNMSFEQLVVSIERLDEPIQTRQPARQPVRAIGEASAPERPGRLR